MNDDYDQAWSKSGKTKISSEDEDKQKESPINAKRIVGILSILDSQFDKHLTVQKWADNQKKQKKKVSNDQLTPMGIGITGICKQLGENEGNDYPIKEQQIQHILLKMNKVNMIKIYEEKSKKYYFITDAGRESLKKIRNEQSGILGIIWDILLP